MEEELEEYLKTKNCRGCSNQCPLNDPGCGRSRIFINDAKQKFEEMYKKDKNNII